MTGTVFSISANAVSVRLADGRVVTARNATGTRTPPRSTVLVLQTASGWDVVGRRR